MKTLTILVEASRIGLGSAVVGVSAFAITEQMVTDSTVAVLGAFFAGAPGKTWNTRAWQLILGIMAGLAAALILRVSELGEAQIRGLIFASAALSARAMFWIDNPESFAADMKSYAQGIRAIYTILPWSKGK